MNRAKILIAFTFLLAFAVCVSAQEIQFINELKSYEFYNQGKLKDIKLKTSTDEDIKAVFGNDCWGGGCEYNEDWEIGFWYYFDGMNRYKIEDETKKTYSLSPEYVNKIFAIVLYPKKPIAFNQILFSREFQSSPSLGEHGVELKNYADSNGLTYTFFDKGNLRQISYNVTEKFEQDIFILTQIQDEPFSN